MAAYPSTTYTVRSAVEVTDSIEVITADSGKPYAYAYGTARRMRFALEENALSSAQLDSLLAFYDANRTVGGITLTWRGTVYTCLFSAPPHIEALGGDKWRCVMRLAEQ